MADRSVSYEFRGKFDSLRTGLASSSQAVRGFGNDLTALDRKGEKMRRGLDTLGGSAGRTGLALGAGFAVVATSAANFEQSMSFVQAATHESAEAMSELRQAALDAGAQTAFSATEAASAIENLAKAGVSTKDILDGGLAGSLDLAAAGGIDVAVAAEQAATAMTQFGLAGEDIPHIADLLAAGAGKAQGEVTDLGAALNQSGLIADQVGLSIEETTGTLSAFASAGLLGSDAGTSFKTMLGALTPNSKEAKKAMDELGISAYDAQGNFIGIAEFAGQLQGALSGLTDQQRQATLETIFGSDAVRAAALLYEQGSDGIQSWIDKTNDSGYAAETAAIRMDNLKGDLEELGGSLETLLIGTGEGQGGFLRGLTQNVTGLVNALNDLPGPVKSTFGALLGLGAIGAGGFWFTAKAITTIANTRLALADLGFTANRSSVSLGRVGRTGAGLVATAAAIGALARATRELADIDYDASGAHRDIEAIAGGQRTEALNRFVSDLEIASNGINRFAEPLREGVGAVGDLLTFGAFDLRDTGLDIAQKNLEAIDQTLASMVETGEKAAAIGFIEQIARESGVGVDVLRESFDDYYTAMANSTPAAEQAATATEAVGEAASGTADDVAALTDAIHKQTTATLAAFDAETAWREALNAARESANKNSAGIRGNSEAALKNREVLSSLAGAWQNQSEAVRANQGRLKAARGAFIETATAMGVPIGQARRLADALIGIPTKKKIDVTVAGADAGVTALRRIITEAQNVPRTIRTDYIVNQINRVNKIGAGEAGPGAGRSADGGTVPKTGMHYADRHPYLLADGEEVISNRFGQADRWRPLLKAINAGRLADGGTAGLADGGTSRRLPGLPFADLGAINLATAGLKALNRALRRSEKALEKETAERDAVRDSMRSLRSDVSGKLTSDLFGDSPGSAWSSSAPGGSFESIMATLQRDIATGAQFKKNATTLKKKGLDGSALETVLRDASPEQLAMLSGRSAADIARFEAALNSRGSIVRGAAGASATAVFGPALKGTEKRLDKVADYVKGLEKTIEKQERESRDAQKRGSGNGARSQKKSRPGVK